MRVRQFVVFDGRGAHRDVAANPTSANAAAIGSLAYAKPLVPGVPLPAIPIPGGVLPPVPAAPGKQHSLLDHPKDGH